MIVIGAGAVGSHVADSLARAGVGFLALADHDRIRPGNLVRHIATDQHVGWAKVAAVRDVIVSRHFNVTEVDAIAGGLVNLDAARDVVNGYDLVIDATANGSVTAMLHHAAKAAGAHVLSVCLKENGQVARVDILPPLAGDPIPQPSPSPASETPLAYESGCFSAVSLTPHAAVIEAASLAARHAIALLTAQPINAAGTERDYR